MTKEEEELHYEEAEQEAEFREAQRQYAEDMGVIYPTWSN